MASETTINGVRPVGNAEVGAIAGKIPGGTVVQDGAVAGLLEQISVDGSCEFVLNPPIPGHVIICRFSEGMLPEVRNALKRNVTVRGSMHYDADHPFPKFVQVKSLEIHPCDDELPSLAALRGLAPGSTGDLTSVDFVRSLRHD